MCVHVCVPLLKTPCVSIYIPMYLCSTCMYMYEYIHVIEWTRWLGTYCGYSVF